MTIATGLVMLALCSDLMSWCTDKVGGFLGLDGVGLLIVLPVINEK